MIRLNHKMREPNFPIKNSLNFSLPMKNLSFLRKNLNIKKIKVNIYMRKSFTI